MANRERGEVGFRAGNKDYVLRLGANEVCDLEDRYNMPFARLVEGLQVNAELRVIRSMLAVGTGLEVKEAGDLIDRLGIDKVGDLIGEAVSLTFPEAATGEENPPAATAG